MFSKLILNSHLLYRDTTETMNFLLVADQYLYTWVVSGLFHRVPCLVDICLIWQENWVDKCSTLNIDIMVPVCQHRMLNRFIVKHYYFQQMFPLQRCFHGKLRIFEYWTGASWFGSFYCIHQRKTSRILGLSSCVGGRVLFCHNGGMV